MLNESQSRKYSLIGRFIKTEQAEERTYLALTLLTGVISALVAVAIDVSTEKLTHLLGTNETFTLKSFALGGLVLFISGWLTTRKFPSTSGSGVPGVRIALAVHHGKMPLKNTIAKFIVSILSLSSGVSLGRESPTIAVTAGVGSFLGSFFQMSKKRVKALLAVGAAGGLAGAFGTPITAVVFTLEEVVGDLNAKILGSIVISSVVASITAMMLTGKESLFSQLHYSLNDPRELIFYLFIGLFAAGFGPLWMKTVIFLRAKSLLIFKHHKLTPIVVAFIIVGLLSQIHPAALGSGHGKLEETLLSLILDWKVVLTIFILKFLGTSICYASGISGGLFFPTLLIGASLGSLVGALAGTLFPEITSNTGAYALVGMGAYLAAVIRAPFTSILLAFEMTRDYNIILPIMIANITSYVLSGRLTDGSIYEQISEQDGIHLPTREDNDILDTMTVEEAMVKDVVTLNSKLTVAEALQGIKGTGISGFPVLNNGRLVGMISKSEIGTNYAKGNGDTIIEKLSEKKLIKIHPDQSLMVALHRLNKFQVSRLPVVSRINDKILLGIITAENIVCQFGYHVKEDEAEKKISIEDYEKEYELRLQEMEKAKAPQTTE